MEWEKPRIVVLEVNVEIGAYQADSADDSCDLALEPDECDTTTPDASPADT